MPSRLSLFLSKILSKVSSSVIFRKPFGRFSLLGDNALLFIILVTAALNHLLTYLAFDWYAGTDSYSYDVAGFQIMTGLVLDPYPLMYRAPLVPIVKNILYMIFEGRQALFGAFLHLLGMATVFLAWRLGRRFSRVAGATTGMFMALSLPISVQFHHLSIGTIYIPLLILTADQFVAWVRDPNRKTSILLGVAVFICCLTRAEAVILIPIFALSGWATRIGEKPLALFLCVSVFMYNAVCFFYFNAFGYWGITKNSGWSLFLRTAVPIKDRFFSERNGPASKRVAEYLQSDIAWELWQGKRASLQDICMLGLNMAQEEMGFLEADKLFLQAGVEGISCQPSLFLKYSVLRLLGQMDIYDPSLSNKEYFSESVSGHMWGYGEERIKFKHDAYWDSLKHNNEVTSPLQWERAFLKARLLSFIGANVPLPKVPLSFQLSDNIERTPQGELSFRFTGDCALGARKSTIHAFDHFFFWEYWGEVKWSSDILKILQAWDEILPRDTLRKGVHTVMWAFWLIAILLAEDRKNKVLLTALLAFVLFLDMIQVVFSDNYGRRFFYFTVTLLWVGGSVGGESLLRWIFKKKREMVT